MGKTLAEKVWDAHVVRKGDVVGGEAQPDLLYIDLHLIHEVTSPQAFEGLRLANRPGGGLRAEIRLPRPGGRGQGGVPPAGPQRAVAGASGCASGCADRALDA